MALFRRCLKWHCRLLLVRALSRDELVELLLLVAFLHEGRESLEVRHPLQDGLGERDVVLLAVDDVRIAGEGQTRQPGEGRMFQRGLADVLTGNGDSIGDEEQPFGELVLSRNE